MKIISKAMALLFFGAILLHCTGCGGTNIFTERTLINEQAIALIENQVVSIESANDDILIYQGDSEQITIKEYISSSSTQEAFVSCEDDGDTLHIKTENNNKDYLVMGSNYRYVEIYLPKSYDSAVAAQTTGANISFDTNMDCTSALFVSASGNITVNTQSGDSFIFDAKTKSGEISITNNDGFSYNEDATAVNGMVGKNPLYTITAQTESGNINLR